MKKYDMVIVGGGPAGLFAGIMCAKKNKKIVILEKNKQCGRKLLMSGAGKCNITQAGDINNFLDCYGKNGRFLKHSLLSFTNKDLMSFFRKNGIDFITTENSRVFPKSLKAQDILDVLIHECKKHQIEIITEAPVMQIEYCEGFFKVKTDSEIFVSTQVTIATGGMSYPHTGSTGDGQAFAKELGHKIVPMKPALTNLKIKNYELSNLSGQSFEGLTYTLWRQGKKIGTYQGDVLLTHTGLSGPGVLNNSRDMQSKDIVKLNFIGGHGEETRQVLIKRFNSSGKTLVKTIIREFPFTKRFIETILELSDIEEDLKCAELKKGQRQTLLTLLTEFEMEIKELGGYHVAMVTTGGVSLKNINPKTMESRTVKGLYFVGEVTDIDGNTGGYNLQAAMSMAFVAGQASSSN